jgi:hypothetical protein
VKSVGYDPSKPLNPENRAKEENGEGKGKGVEGNGEAKKGNWVDGSILEFLLGF